MIDATVSFDRGSASPVDDCYKASDDVVFLQLVKARPVKTIDSPVKRNQVFGTVL